MSNNLQIIDNFIAFIQVEEKRQNNGIMRFVVFLVPQQRQENTVVFSEDEGLPTLEIFKKRTQWTLKLFFFLLSLNSSLKITKGKKKNLNKSMFGLH